MPEKSNLEFVLSEKEIICGCGHLWTRMKPCCVRAPMPASWSGYFEQGQHLGAERSLPCQVTEAPGWLRGPLEGGSVFLKRAN